MIGGLAGSGAGGASDIGGVTPGAGAAGDPFAEITSKVDDPMALTSQDVDVAKPLTFPAASVTVLQLRT